MKVKNEDKVLIGVGLVAVGGIGYMYWRKKQKEKNDDLLNAVPQYTPDPPKNQTVSTVSTGAVLNKNKMLGKGSKGIEVRELQRLLGVEIDGDFGKDTLTALKSKKGVANISINAYLKTPAKSAVKEKPTALVTPRVGQKVMASQNDVSVFNAKKTASGSYFNSGTKPLLGSSFDYGEHIGVFVGSKLGGQYLINRDGVYYFVNASAVKGY